MNRPDLTATSLDAMLKPMAKPERLLGAPAIAKALGVSEEVIPRLARTPGVPIYMPPGLGRYVAFRSELDVWMRTKPAA